MDTTSLKSEKLMFNANASTRSGHSRATVS